MPSRLVSLYRRLWCDAAVSSLVKATPMSLLAVFAVGGTGNTVRSPSHVEAKSSAGSCNDLV